MRNRLLVGSAAAFVLAVAASAVILTLALPASGHAGPPRGDPATFVIRVVDLVVSDDYEDAWQSLYPAHQRVAPRDEYVTCELRTPVGWKLRSAKVLKVAERARLLPGETKPKQVTLVTLRLVIGNQALHTVGGFTHTFTAVPDGARWTWVLTQARYGVYHDDSCGEGYSPTPGA
jgi:hypothetical protein